MPPIEDEPAFEQLLLRCISLSLSMLRAQRPVNSARVESIGSREDLGTENHLRFGRTFGHMPTETQMHYGADQ